MPGEPSLLELFKERAALLEGHFLLSSGLHSPHYLQCARVLMDPPLATRLGAELAARLAPLLGGRRPGAVVAPALGGVIVSHEVARGLSCRALFTERQDGAMRLRRGFTIAEREPLVVVEDVITTGGSTREVIAEARRHGGQLLAVGCLVDRSGGMAELGAPLASLLALTVETYEPERCPLCARGDQPEKPGSRG